MAKQLSNASDIATELTNVVDVMSPILDFQPKDGLALIIKGIVQQGEEVGIPIYADLKDVDGNPLPTGETTVALQFKAPGDDDRTTVSHPLTNIRAYNTLSISEQQNVEHIDAVKHTLKGTQEAVDAGKMPRLGFNYRQHAYVSIKCPKQIDWTQSSLYIDRNAVEQVS